MKDIIIITGFSGSGKSTFVTKYLEVFSFNSVLIEGKEVCNIASFTEDKIQSLKQCTRLIIDDFFLIEFNYSLWKSILEVLEFRFNNSKLILLTGYTDTFASERHGIIKRLYSAAQIYNIVYNKTDKDQLMKEIYLTENKIDQSNPMKIYQMKKEGACLHCTETELNFQPNEWVQLLQETSFLKFLEIGELQCLSCDEEGNDFLSGFLPLTQAKEYFLRFTQLNNLPTITKEKFEIALKSWDSLDNSKLYLGVDFYKDK